MNDEINVVLKSPQTCFSLLKEEKLYVWYLWPSHVMVCEYKCDRFVLNVLLKVCVKM